MSHNDLTLAQRLNCENMPLFSTNIGNLGGTSALAFTIHTNFGPMIKCNKNQKNNIRDLGITYAAGLLIYGSIGAFGSYGIISNYLSRSLAPALFDLPPPPIQTETSTDRTFR